MNTAHLVAKKGIAAPLDNPVRWFARRMAILGAVILLSMAAYTIAAIIHYSREPAPEVDPSTQSPETVPPVKEPSIPDAPERSPTPNRSAEALVARADDLVVGAPVYAENKEGAVVGHITNVSTDSQGRVTAFEVTRMKGVSGPLTVIAGRHGKAFAAVSYTRNYEGVIKDNFSFAIENVSPETTGDTSPATGGVPEPQTNQKPAKQ